MTSLDHKKKIFELLIRTALLATKWGMKRPAKLEIISLRGFCQSRVVNSVTSLIGFDKKGGLAILWKYFILSATYWTFCCGAIPCHNLAFVQTDKIVPLSCKMKTFVLEVQFGNHLFTIYFIEIQFALVRKDVGVFMPLAWQMRKIQRKLLLAWFSFLKWNV